MDESRDLIEQAIKGIRPPRTPIFDLLCNDAVIEHFAGSRLDGTDDEAAVCAAVGRAVDGTRWLTVVFHSDGYVMEIMPDLVAAGIDGFNPIEKAAGMDVYALRRQFPELILVGGR